MSLNSEGFDDFARRTRWRPSSELTITTYVLLSSRVSALSSLQDSSCSLVLERLVHKVTEISVKTSSSCRLQCIKFSDLLIVAQMVCFCGNFFVAIRMAYKMWWFTCGRGTNGLLSVKALFVVRKCEVGEELHGLYWMWGMGTSIEFNHIFRMTDQHNCLSSHRYISKM